MRLKINVDETGFFSLSRSSGENNMPKMRKIERMERSSKRSLQYYYSYNITFIKKKIKKKILIY